MYPAVGVDQLLVKVSRDNLGTQDRLTEVLSEALDHTEDAEDGEAELVVELEGGIVNQTFLVSDKMFEITKHREHCSSSWRVSTE